MENWPLFRSMFLASTKQTPLVKFIQNAASAQMESKNPFQQEDDERDVQGLAQSSKRRREVSQQTEAGSLHNTIGSGHLSFLPPIRDIERSIEVVDRRSVREELDGRLHRSPTIHEAGTFGAKYLELAFESELPPTIFTNSKIKAKDGTPIKIALYNNDNRSKSIVTEGPSSSIKIEICVLDGDFDSEDWTEDEFKAKISRPRENKGKLLKGGTIIKLENGVAYITGEISFTDNSSWTRSRHFRLGAKVVQTFNESNIREGRSEPFMVKHYRLQACKKHGYPSLNDEVGCLKGIGKSGKIHKNLCSNGIKTVKDLLRLYKTDPASLQKIIGSNQRKWEKIIEHAENARDIDDGMRYIYPRPTEGQTVSLVFNCIYEVVGVSFERQNYRSLESLNVDEKFLVEIVKQHAYKNVKDLLPFEATPHGFLETLAGVQVSQRGAADQALQHCVSSIAGQGQPETWRSLCEPSTSTSYFDQGAHYNQLGYSQQPELEEIPVSHIPTGQFIVGAYNDGNEWPLTNESHIDQSGSCFSPPTNAWEQVNHIYPYGDGAESSNPNTAVPVYISSKGKCKTVWYKIRGVLKLCFFNVKCKRNLY